MNKQILENHATYKAFTVKPAPAYYTLNNPHSTLGKSSKLFLQVLTMLTAGDCWGRATNSGKCNVGSTQKTVNMIKLNTQCMCYFLQPTSYRVLPSRL